MEIFNTQFKARKTILALGAESAGNFSVYKNGTIFFSENFGDLLDDANFDEYKNELSEFLKKEKIRPDIIMTDLHPLYRTTLLGEELAKKYKAKHIQVQHHIAHIFSTIGNFIVNKGTCPVKRGSAFYGVAMDGTGYGLDGKIWGGEVFRISKLKVQISNQIPNLKFKIQRMGHLENQIMIGGDLAIQEPTRVLIAVLSKFLPKKKIHAIIKNVSSFDGRKIMIHPGRTYTRQEFEILYSQLQQNFNCQETSSTGRILDAVSVLLGFAENKREYKHEAAELLEKNSGAPYDDLKPKIIYNKKEELYILQTTSLFEYLVKNLRKDKRRLAATAQLYIAQGLHEIALKAKSYKLKTVYFAGGLANNKIISAYLESKGAHINKTVPRGDAGISFGQIVYFLAK